MRSRLHALDIFRGLTIALMVLVNSPGNAHPYMFLQHSAWDGCSFADIVFPFFIVIVGISIVIAFNGREVRLQKIAWRTFYLFLIGLFINAFPNHFDPYTVRIMGVLQRIAICYLVGAALYLKTSMRVQVMIGIILLLAYTQVTKAMIFDVDKYVLGLQHLYGKGFDPEGLLNTLPAIASVLMGCLIGQQYINRASDRAYMKWLCVFGFGACVLAWRYQYIVPINKAMWSSTYVLWTGGLAALAFAALFYACELKQYARYFRVFEVLGRHALFIYVFHVLGLKLIAQTNFKIYAKTHWLDMFSEQNAALIYALVYTSIWVLITLGYAKVSELRKKR